MKILISNYTFDASAKTVTIDQFPTITLEQVRLITNVTDGIIIFSFATPTKGATLSGGNILTLEYDTTSMSDTDSLAIDFDDQDDTISGTVAISGSVAVTGPLTDTQLRASPVPVSGTVTANLGTLNGAATEAKQDDIITALGGTLIVDTGLLQPLTDTQLRASPVPVTVQEPLSIDDNGASLTVDGTVGISGSVAVTGPLTDTELRATDVDVNVTNASLAVTGTFWQATQPVSVASLPLPTGASTSANQTTIIGHVDGIETLLGTIDADTSNISTKIDTLAGAVSGTEMQVDVITLPTVTVQATNLDIRDLTFASDKVDASGTVLGAGTNNIGDVDVLSLPSLPSGSNTIGAVRITDGTDVADILDLTNSNPLTVAIVDGTGNQITSFAGTQYTEGDIDATITGTAMLAESGSNTLKVLQVDSTGHLIVHQGTQSLALSDSFPNTGHVPTDDSSNPVGAISFGFNYNGTTWDRVRGNATDGLLVNLGTNNDVTITGTVAVTQSGTWDEVGINDSGNSITVDNNGTFAVQNTPSLSTSGGWTPFHLVSAASTNATVIKASAGQLGGWHIYNNATSFRKIAFHDTASTPTAGASVAWAIVMPPLSAANVIPGEKGIQFSTGIAITTVTGLADSDSTGVALNDLVINFFYN